MKDDMAKMPFNLNENVWVRLTEHGRQILRDDAAAFRKSFPSVGEYVEPTEEDGWSRWQLWNLMQSFGEHITMGRPVPFETTIMLPLPPPPKGETL